jgi:SRSO17 transposase
LTDDKSAIFCCSKPFQQEEQIMLPQCRYLDESYPVPKFSLVEQDLEAFIPQLREFLSEFDGCFSRSEPRENFHRYIVGQFSQVERKSIEPIALQVEGGEVRSMQRFISDVVWDEAAIITKHHAFVGNDMGDPAGVLIFDESGCAKKGEDSAGVAKQYCGSLGKVENCQVGVFAAYASPQGYALLDTELFVPEKWFEESHKDKRKKCNFPEELAFKSKPQLAVEMLKRVEKCDALAFKYVVADSIYGVSPHFIGAIEQRIGLTYLVQVPSDTLCWMQHPSIREKSYKYKGQLKTKKYVPPAEKKPIKVSDFAKGLNDVFWYRRRVCEGTKGPSEYEFTKRRVTLCQDGLPGKTVWLIIKRTIAAAPSYSFYISNAPISTRLKTFVWLSGIRWAIEQCFEETKTELGLDHYEVRKYPGWRHHMLSCILAHFFLWHLRIRLGEKSSLAYDIAA